MTPATAPREYSITAPSRLVPAGHGPSFIHGAYYPSWKVYRNRLPSCMSLDRLTHVFYAFMRVKEDGTVYHLDEKADLHLPIASSPSPGLLATLTHLRDTTNPHLTLILSLGGASGSSPFPALAACPRAREHLAQCIRAQVDRHGFSGVDLDWEHPATTADGRNYVELVRAVRAALPAPRYIVTAALPSGEWCLRLVPVAELVAQLDFVNLMAYDFAGPWTTRSGHHARLWPWPSSHAEDPFAKRSAAGAVEYLVRERGVPARKVVLGVPVYGRVFVGVTGPGDEGFLRCSDGSDDGCVEYRDLPSSGCDEVVNEHVWGAECVVERDDGLTEWISYDCPRTVQEKARFVREMGLGGLFYWTGVADKEGEGSLMRAGYEALFDCK